MRKDVERSDRLYPKICLQGLSNTMKTCLNSQPPGQESNLGTLECKVGVITAQRKLTVVYEGVSKSFRTGRLKRELQMVQLSAIKCSCVAVLLVSLVGFAVITLCVASQRVFIVVSVYFVVDSVRKLLDTSSFMFTSCLLLALFKGVFFFFGM
jgi:hypothetical protein